MVRLATVFLILTVVACVCGAVPTGQREARQASYAVTAKNGSLGLGHISGGKFGPGSFSIGHGGDTAGSGHGGHGGNQGTNSYGGPGGDTGHTSYA